jgi:dihydropteroate synthase
MIAFNNSFNSEDKLIPSKNTLLIRGKLITLNQPLVMGILNITPDSFYSGSRVEINESSIVERAHQMISEGVDILDVGGYSSRPGAKEVSLDEELKRTIPAILAIRKLAPDIIISIDTFRSVVAKAAIDSGADMVNDISAGGLDSEMIPTVGNLKVPFIAMHMRGNPQNMQTFTGYENILLDMVKYFSDKKQECLKFGINDVIIDPGFGFSKTQDQNYWILKNLSYFKTINAPILIGVSRKSMIYKTLNRTPEEALNGTTALHMAALLGGANILRVHDVKEAKETIQLYKQLYP